MTKGLNKVDLRYSLVRIESESEGEPIVGTGVLISKEGHIITCSHLIVNPRAISVVAASINGVFDIELKKVIEEDYFDKPKGDFCLLKIKSKLPTHLKPLRLLEATQSNGNPFSSFGFPASNDKNGVGGSGIIESNDLASEHGYPVFQLEETNNITHGFSGAPIYDKVLGGVVGIINSGVINTEENRQLGTSFGVAFDFMAPKLKDTYRFNLSKPDIQLKLPYGFIAWEALQAKDLREQKEQSRKKTPPESIQYKDYLYSNNLPYISRDEFKRIHPSTSETFATENAIINNLINSKKHSGGAVIYGEGGIGKTRLMYEIGQRMRMFGWQVIEVRSYAEKIEELLRFLIPQSKYLLLFDYVEESQAFHSDIITRIQRHVKGIKIRALVNSRFTFKGSGKFPENFYKIHLSDSNGQEIKYREHVIQKITQDIANHFILNEASFFKLKPSFAVFLAYLNYKAGLDTKDIRQVPAFKTWIAKSFRLTLDEKKFDSINPKVFYLIAALPAINKQIDALYTDDLKAYIRALKNDGWIEQFTDKQGNSILKSVHDTVVDELVLIYFENVGKEGFKELQYFFEFSAKFGLQSSWLHSMERVIESPFIPKKEEFFSLLNCYIPHDINLFSPIKIFLGGTSVLFETDRIRLFTENLSFFRDSISSFIEGNSIESTSGFVKAYLNDNAEKSGAQSVLISWLNKQDNPDFIKVFVLRYLKINATKKSTSSLFQALLDNLPNPQYIRVFLLKYLKQHHSLLRCCHLFHGWLEKEWDIKEVEDLILNFLEIHRQQEHIGPMLQALGLRIIFKDNYRRYFLAYLSENLQTEYSPSILLIALEESTSLEWLQEIVINYLETNIQHAASYQIIKSWITSNGDEQFILPFLKQYLTEHTNTIQVFIDWINSGANIQTIESHMKSWYDLGQTSYEIKRLKYALQGAKIEVPKWLETEEESPLGEPQESPSDESTDKQSWDETQKGWLWDEPDEEAF